MTVDEVMHELYKDRTIYRRSGGGITFSGGEAMVQHDYLLDLLKACKSLGWTTAIETTGYASQEVIEKIVPWLDLVMMDIKHFDAEIHKEFTGVDNEKILLNAHKIASIANEMIIRVPVVPGFNAKAEYIRDIARFTTTLPGVNELHLLPYHDLGSNKYAMLGKAYELFGIQKPEAEMMEDFKAIVEEQGLICKIGG
jgi:pyruvate formate lyase activating enzyme